MQTTETRAAGPFATGPVAGPLPVERDQRFDNQPPLGERIMLEFEEDLVREGLLERAADLVAAAGRAPACDCKEAAGKVGDFIKQCSAFEKALEAVREKHNRPLIDARTALKGRTDGLFLPISDAVKALRQSLDTFMRAEQERVDKERRDAEAERKRLQDEADSRASLPEYAPRVEAPKIAAPVARGEYGSRVGTTTVWNFEIENMRQVPDRYLKHPKVKEALESVIRAAIRTEKVREVKGVRIWEGTQAVVR